MRRPWFAACAALVLATAAVAASPVAPDPVFSHPASPDALTALTGATARSLAAARVVRGSFVQRRHLAGLTRPLESRGTFLFARDAGIEWRTVQPFESQFVLTDAGITQRDAGGEPLRIDAAEQPALSVVSRVFLALFALDVATLANDFHLYGERRGAGWALGLEPRAVGLASVFRRAIVTGGASVERVVLEDGNGDRSEIDLREVSYDRAALSAEELRRFQP